MIPELLYWLTNPLNSHHPGHLPPPEKFGLLCRKCSYFLRDAFVVKVTAWQRRQQKLRVGWNCHAQATKNLQWVHMNRWISFFMLLNWAGPTKCGNLSENLLMFQPRKCTNFKMGERPATSRNGKSWEFTYAKLNWWISTGELINRITAIETWLDKKYSPPLKFNIDLPKMTPYLKGDTFSKAHHFWYRYRPMICGCLSSLPFFLATDRFHLGSPKRFLRLEIFVDKTRLPVIVKKNLEMANATSSRQILFNMQWQRNNVYN